MPIPLIVGGIIAAAIAGVKKGIDAKNDIKKANKVNALAQNIAQEAEKFIVEEKEKTMEAIENFGREKIRILSTSVNDFVLSFEKIKNIRLKNSEGIEELKKFNPNSESFKQLKKAVYEAKQIAVNGLAAVGSGALLAYGTYSVVMSGLGGLLVTATTGTALGTLSGTAAVNATLAWLGGGALSVGGFGIMGGMVVLGGIVAGPALAVGGVIFASQARKALNDAHSNYDKAEAFKEQAKNIGVALEGIRIRAGQLVELLQKLDSFFVKHIFRLEDIIKRRGSEWQNYSQSEQHDIYQCVQLAQTVKIVLDTPLLKQDGELDEATALTLEQGCKYIHCLAEKGNFGRCEKGE